MIGMVLVTHGRLAEEFISAMEHVVGHQGQLKAICIGPDDDMEIRQANIKDAVAEVNSGSGVLILTDMVGGTPSNLAIKLMERGKVEVLVGINLPMLIKLASIRSNVSLKEAASEAVKSGQKYIDAASNFMKT